MTRVPSGSRSFGPAALPTSLPDPTTSAGRGAQRAVAELTVGTPVVLAGETSGILLATETACVRSIAEFKALTAGEVILVAAACGVQVLQTGKGQRDLAVADVIAPALEDALLCPGLLLCLADPTLGASPLAGLTPVPPPASAREIPSLVKSAHLLPAALLAPPASGRKKAASCRSLLSVSLADIRAAGGTDLTLRRPADQWVPPDAALDQRIIAFRAAERGTAQLAILIGDPAMRDAPLVRVHPACSTVDALGSLRRDCGARLGGAIGRIATEGAGAVLYLSEEGRGIGFINKLRACRLQDAGLDTLEANRGLGCGSDAWNDQVAAEILSALGLTRVCLITGSSDTLGRLSVSGITIGGREPLEFPPNGVNDRYLATKVERFGHLLG